MLNLGRLARNGTCLSWTILVMVIWLKQFNCKSRLFSGMHLLCVAFPLPISVEIFQTKFLFQKEKSEQLCENLLWSCDLLGNIYML